MKKVLALLLALLMVLTMAACAKEETKTETKEETKEEEKVLVIGYTDYAPMNYTEDGKLIGFDTEFAEAVCKKLGMTPKFQLIDWGNKYMELNSGNIGCIWNGFTANCADDNDGIQRSEKVDFSYYYMNNEQVVIVKKDNLATLNSKDALAGKKGSAEVGSAGEGVAKDLIGENDAEKNFIGKTAQMDALTEVKAGTVDFAVLDKTLAMANIGKGDYAGLAVCDGVALESEKYAIGFKKGSELTAKVNEAIKALAEDGTLEALAEKYNLSNYLITEY